MSGGNESNSAPRYNRREALRLGGVALAAFLTGCSPRRDTSTPIPKQDNTTPQVMPKELPSQTPELQVQGDKFVAGGKEVILRGAVTNHFVYKTPLEVFKHDVDWLKGNGANFVVVQWNAGFLQNPAYILNLANACEYAKSQGMRTELTLHSRGLKPGSDWDPLQIQKVDNQIVKNWDTLLGDPIIAERFAKSVDIFSPLSEPNYNPSGQSITWGEWKPLAIETTSHIRNLLKKDAVISVSGVNYGSDAWNIFNDPLNLQNAAVEIHPYQFFDQRQNTNFKAFVQEMKKRNMLAFVGEMGHDDQPAFVENQYDFFVKNGISFAVYSINSSSDYPSVLLIKGDKVTPNGKKASKYFKAGK